MTGRKDVAPMNGPFGGIGTNEAWKPKDNAPEPKPDGGGADPDYVPPGEAVKARFDLVPFDKITFGTAPAYSVKGLLCSTGLIVVWGAPKCGKSFWVFDLVMHVALGWEYRGRRVRQGNVVYCALEGCAAFKSRVEAFRQKHLGDDSSDVPFHLMASPMSLIADQASLISSVRLTLGDAIPAIVVVDTLNRSLAGSENSDEDMAKYIQAADAMRDAFHCAVVIVHHCGHEGTRPRGHSSLMGALDVQIAVKRDAANNILATVELMKDGREGDQIESRLEVVEIGEDEEGDKITSCVIVPADGGTTPGKKATRRKPPTGAAAKTALAGLHEAIGKVGAFPPTADGIPKNVKCVKVEQWRTYSYMKGISTSKEPRAQQKAFKLGSESLIADGYVAMWGDFVWPCQA